MAHTDGRRRLPTDRNAITHRFQVGEQEGYVTVGLYDDGRPGEVFMTVSKQGSTVRGLTDAVSIMISVALQYGVPIGVIADKLKATRYEPAGLTRNPEIPNATSIMDYVGRWLENRFTHKALPPGTLVATEYPVIEVRELVGALRTASKEDTGGSTPPRLHQGNVCPDCGAMLAMEEMCEKCHSCGWTKC